MNYAYITIFASVLEKIFRKIYFGQIRTFLNSFPPLLFYCAKDQTEGIYARENSAVELYAPLLKQPSERTLN